MTLGGLDQGAIVIDFDFRFNIRRLEDLMRSIIADALEKDVRKQADQAGVDENALMLRMIEAQTKLVTYVSSHEYASLRSHCLANLTVFTAQTPRQALGVLLQVEQCCQQYAQSKGKKTWEQKQQEQRKKQQEQEQESKSNSNGAQVDSNMADINGEAHAQHTQLRQTKGEWIIVVPFVEAATGPFFLSRLTLCSLHPPAFLFRSLLQPDSDWSRRPCCRCLSLFVCLVSSSCWCGAHRQRVCHVVAGEGSAARIRGHGHRHACQGAHGTWRRCSTKLSRHRSSGQRTGRAADVVLQHVRRAASIPAQVLPAVRSRNQAAELQTSGQTI